MSPVPGQAGRVLQPRPLRGELNLVIVIDGLRACAVTPEVTPTLASLAQDGVWCTHGRAAVPAVTRVNAATLATGRYPAATGITGNAMYLPAVDPAAAFTTADAANLQRLRDATGRIVQAPTLGEVLQEAGKQFVAIGSGSSGSMLCVHPLAAQGVGTVINADDPRKGAPLAFPPHVATAVRERFGPPPAKGVAATNGASVDYAVRVLCDYVLPELAPDVALVWLTEPDASQHRHGVASPAARDALRNVDQRVGDVLDRLEELGLGSRANVVVVSDHGFSDVATTVDLAGQLVDAGLKQARGSTDVVVAPTGSAGVYAEHPALAERVVAYLQRQPWVDALFTPARNGAGERGLGRVEGTLALDLLGLAHPERGPDILVTFPWRCARRPGSPQSQGVATFVAQSSGAGRRPRAGDHGSVSPQDLTIPFVGWGADLARRVRSRVPVGTVDVTPTLLHLAGLPARTWPPDLDGRVAHELLDGDPAPGDVAVATAMVHTATDDGGYGASLAMSTVDSARYVDRAWRSDDRALE